MRQNYPLTKFWLYIMLILSIGWFNSSFAQFSVVSVSPAHGSTNVDTSVTFSIVFNAPLDTNASFPYPEDFFLNLYIFPDSLTGEPDSISLSPDSQTLYVHGLPLADNTTFLFVVVNARSQNRDSLSSPARTLFTTGSSLPGNSISGTVSYPSGDPAGTTVFLFDENPFSDSGFLVNASIVPNSSGNYTTDLVESGTYWPAALKNYVINEWGEVDIMPGSVLGFYDSNSDGSPDSIDVSGNISGIDISITELAPQTARNPYPAVLTAAQMWAGDARLVRMGGDEIDGSGNSLFWQYEFYSPSSMTYRVWMALGSIIAGSPPDEVITDTTALPTNWLDSDAIFAITEQNGGSDFRQNFPGADVYAFLGYLSFDNDSNQTERMPSRNNAKINSKSLNLSSIISGMNKTLSESSNEMPAAWEVQYYVDSLFTNLFFIIDAVSGELLNVPSTAQVAEQKALPVAQQWAPDAKLWMMSSQGLSVDPQGKTDLWNCIYYSASLDSFHYVHIWGQIMVDEGDPGFIQQDTSTVEMGWMDSDATIAVAEAIGGAAYRQAHPDVYVYASLSRGLFGGNPSLTVWEFFYGSSSSPPLILYVDAITGTIITDIEDASQTVIPERFALYQNYPNPFNPTTTIKFELPQSESVRLEIFNIAGQKVATIIDAKMTAGSHDINFDAQKLASGIYFYRLSTPSVSLMKKMALIR
jgi:hypothetical protein